MRNAKDREESESERKTTKSKKENQWGVLVKKVSFVWKVVKYCFLFSSKTIPQLLISGNKCWRGQYCLHIYFRTFFFFLYHNSHMSFFLCGISLGRGNPDLYRVSRFKARELFLSFSTQFWWSKNHYKLYSNVHDLCVLSMFISPILSNANWEVLYFKFRQQSVYLVRY